MSTLSAEYEDFIRDPAKLTAFATWVLSSNNHAAKQARRDMHFVQHSNPHRDHIRRVMSYVYDAADVTIGRLVSAYLRENPDSQ